MAPDVAQRLLGDAKEEQFGIGRQTALVADDARPHLDAKPLLDIGGYVNVPQVVEYAKGLPDVTYAEHNLYTCSEEGISSKRRRSKNTT